MHEQRYFHNVLAVLFLSTYLTHSNAQDLKQMRELENAQMVMSDMLDEAHAFWSNALQGSLSSAPSGYPLANDDSFKTTKEVPVTVTVLTNDTGDYDPVTLTNLSDPDNGVVVLNSDNTFTYTPNTCFSGIDTFPYQICNTDKSFCSVATVSVTVIPPPEAVNDSDDTRVNTPVNIPVLGNDTGEYDPDTLTKLTDPSNGNVILNVDNTFTYTPSSGYVGVNTFTYQICNTDNLCSIATVTIYIEGAPSLSPTFSPSQMPSFQPSESKCCNLSPLQYNAFLIDIATGISGSISPGTPQQQALDWLLSETNYCECDISSCKIYERYSLAVFYFSSGGDEWNKCKMPDLSSPQKIDEANMKCDISTTPTPPALDIGLLSEGTDAWLTPGDACNWAGIVCRETSGCVDRLELENNNVIGTLPGELERLLEIRFLVLENGKISGTIPSEWGALTEMLFIDLDFNELEGTIPDYIFTFTNLLQLDLNDNIFSGGLSTKIGDLSDLIFLQLHENEFSGPLPSELGNLSNLRVGSFSGNDFTGVVNPILANNNMSVLEADCKGNNPQVICTACTECK